MSSDFPTTPDAYDTTYNDDVPGQTVLGDVFVSKFNGNLQNLLASTFLGGSFQESANSIFIESNGNVRICWMITLTSTSATPILSDPIRHLRLKLPKGSETLRGLRVWLKGSPNTHGRGGNF